MSVAIAEGQTPHLPANVIGACLDDLVRAVTRRLSGAEEQKHANEATMTLILSFMPHDVIQMMAAGQAVLFNALTADGARDILAGMIETMKPRARSGVVAMGRIVTKNLEMLSRLQGLLDPTALKTPPAEEAPPPRPKAMPCAEPPAPDAAEICEAPETSTAEISAAPVSALEALRAPLPEQKTNGDRGTEVGSGWHPSRKSRRLLARKLTKALHSTRPTPAATGTPPPDKPPAHALPTRRTATPPAPAAAQDVPDAHRHRT
jgi:hypothetical protein